MNTFNNKVAVITGAGSGIGQSLAIQLNQAGAHLALCDVNKAGLEKTHELLNSRPSHESLHIVDVSNLGQMQQFAVDVKDQHDQVDILINNAGITLTPTQFDEITEEQFERVININMWGVYNGIRAFLPHLRTRPEASIVNISSLAGLVGLMGYSPYAMSKFAVRGLSEALQMELVGTHISVLVVHPGGVKTNLIKDAPDLTEIQRDGAHQAFTQAAWLTPQETARQILRAVQKKQNRLILGKDAKFVTTIRLLFPRRFPTILHGMFERMTFK